METFDTEIKPHSTYLDTLFAHKSKVNRVFRDVLGLYEIHHISISYVTEHNNLISLSSTPAIEFNLFNSQLWQYDQTYSSLWYKKCHQASWQSLYSKIRYDELYYIKQLKHQLPLGISLATRLQNRYLIYAFASHKDDAEIAQDFHCENENFYKIGQYCTNSLLSVFHQFEEKSEQLISTAGTL